MLDDANVAYIHLTVDDLLTATETGRDRPCSFFEEHLTAIAIFNGDGSRNVEYSDSNNDFYILDGIESEEGDPTDFIGDGRLGAVGHRAKLRMR